MGSSQLWHVDLEDGADCTTNAKPEGLGLAMSAFSLLSLSFLSSLSQVHVISLSDAGDVHLVETNVDRLRAVHLTLPGST